MFGFESDQIQEMGYRFETGFAGQSRHLGCQVGDIMNRFERRARSGIDYGFLSVHLPWKSLCKQ
jgi:hypothetical protein